MLYFMKIRQLGTEIPMRTERQTYNEANAFISFSNKRVAESTERWPRCPRHDTVQEELACFMEMT